MKHIYIYTHTHIQGRKIHTILNSIFLLKTEKNPNKIQATKKKKIQHAQSLVQSKTKIALIPMPVN